MKMYDLKNKCDRLFNENPDIADRIRSTVKAHGMYDLISRGVAVGFSGGSDSVLLLIFLRFLQKELDFKLCAIHVNHSIRENTSKRDEDFSRSFCDALGIDFYSFVADVPEYARELRIGTEDAARRKRYRIFSDFCDSHTEYACIATAHNATDNLETVIFNLMRGTGTKGLTGISPVRDNIIRPLIDISKPTISSLLENSEIPFVVDETNFSLDYTRNYIRHEILPRLERLNPDPEAACSRAVANLRADCEYIESASAEYFKEEVNSGCIKSDSLCGAPYAVFVRVVSQMIKEHGCSESAEAVHFRSIRECLMREGDFEISLPGECSFVRRGKICKIDNTQRREVKGSELSERVLHDGINEIPELSLAIALTDDKLVDFSSNVYKISIQADLYSAIIDGELKVRTRRNGDAYSYGGITRKVKKLFNDKKIPTDLRDRIPIIIDDSGIVWVAGFGVRTDSDKKSCTRCHRWITILEKV